MRALRSVGLALLACALALPARGALVSAGPILFPASDHAMSNGGNPTFETSVLLDASGEKGCFVFYVGKAGTLGKVRFGTATVTTGDVLKWSFQNVDATTGMCDETADQYRTVTIADANDNAAFLTGLVTADGTDTGAKRTVTAGELLGIAFEFDSYVAGNLNIATRTTVAPLGAGLSYTAHKTGGSWAKVGAAYPRFALEYDDGTYAPLQMVDAAINRITAETFNSTSSPDERGNIITPTFKSKSNGGAVVVDADADGDLVLYDTNGTSTMGSCTIDKDVRRDANAGISYCYWTQGEQTLNAGSAYRLVWKPTASNSSIYVGTYPAAVVLDQLSGGQAVHKTSRTDAGAWTEVTTARYFLWLHISALDDGAGGGASTLVNGGLVQ